MLITIHTQFADKDGRERIEKEYIECDIGRIKSIPENDLVLIQAMGVIIDDREGKYIISRDVIDEMKKSGAIRTDIVLISENVEVTDYATVEVPR